MRSCDSAVTTIANSGSPLHNRKRYLKFLNYTSHEVIEYFRKKLPLNKQDLEDCVELLRESFDFHTQLDQDKKVDLMELLEEMSFLDLCKGSFSSKGVLFYDNMVAFIRQSDTRVLSEKDEEDLSKILTSSIPKYFKRTVKDLLQIDERGFFRSSYNFIIKSIDPALQMKMMAMKLRSWERHCLSLASDFTSILNIAWKYKNMPGVLCFDAVMFQAQYIDPLLSEILVFDNATTESAKINTYTVSYERARQLEDIMYAMASCIYPKLNNEIIKEHEYEKTLAQTSMHWELKI